MRPAGPAPTIPTWVRRLGMSAERGGEIGDEVLRVLDPDREPHQGIADPEGRAYLRRDRAVRHQRRMLDQAFDAAEAFSEGEQPAALEEAPGIVEGAGEVGGDHAAEGTHLLRGERVLRMAWQTRIIDAADLGMALKPLRDRQRRGAMALHPQCQRLEPAQRQKRIERPLDRADRVLQELQALAQLRIVADYGDTANHVGMAVEVFGGRMHN